MQAFVLMRLAARNHGASPWVCLAVSLSLLAGGWVCSAFSLGVLTGLAARILACFASRTSTYTELSRVYAATDMRLAELLRQLAGTRWRDCVCERERESGAGARGT